MIILKTSDAVWGCYAVAPSHNLRAPTVLDLVTCSRETPPDFKLWFC